MHPQYGDKRLESFCVCISEYAQTIYERRIDHETPQSDVKSVSTWCIEAILFTFSKLCENHSLWQFKSHFRGKFQFDCFCHCAAATNAFKCGTRMIQSSKPALQSFGYGLDCCLWYFVFRPGLDFCNRWLFARTISMTDPKIERAEDVKPNGKGTPFESWFGEGNLTVTLFNMWSLCSFATSVASSLLTLRSIFLVLRKQMRV